MKYCCENFEAQVRHRCEEHPDLRDCPDSLIVEIAKGIEYGLRIHDGGSSFVGIRNCPWCGSAVSAPVLGTGSQHPSSGASGGRSPATPNDLAVAHLQAVIGLIERAGAVPAECSEHVYSHDAFGSWTVTFRCRGVPIRLVCDGREGELFVERSASKKPPYQWGRVVSVDYTARKSLGHDVVQAIQTAAG